MIKDHNKELVDYDKRIGVPNFDGWQDREEEAFKKSGLNVNEYFK